MPPFLFRAVTLLPALTACMYCWLPSSARVGLLPGCQAQSRPLISTNTVWVASQLMTVMAEWSDKTSVSGWVCLLSR